MPQIELFGAGCSLGQAVTEKIRAWLVRSTASACMICGTTQWPWAF